jgi:tetratricopeptide (TPR) repeat protein
MKALAIQEREAPNSLTVATSYNNIGSLYDDQGKNEKAFEYYMKALAIQEREAPNSLTVATSYNNIGSLYKNQGKNEKAFDFFEVFRYSYS